MKLLFTLFHGLILILLPAFQGHCQISDTYIITLDGDTIRTEVKYSSKLHVNNREVVAKEKGKFARYGPGQLKGFCNGKDVFESRSINGVSAFLLRRITGHLNLYLCDETIVNEMIKMENPVNAAVAIGAATGGMIGGAVAGAVTSVVTEAVHMPAIPITGQSEGGLKIFNPNTSKKKRLQELQEYFAELPEISSIINREPFNLEVYIEAVEASNHLQEKENQRSHEENKKADGF